MATLANPTTTTEAKIKCPFCAEVIAAEAKKCKHCGEFLDQTLRQARMPTPRSTGMSVVPNGKTKVAAGLLAIFLGGIGMHKFYLGQVGQGIVYLLFCWTFIPALIGLIEGIIYLTMSDQAFAEKYGVALRSTEARPLAAKLPGPPQDPHNSILYKVGRALNRSFLLKFLVCGLGIFIGLYVLGAIVEQMRESSASGFSSSTVTDSSATNDAELLIARCGQPSSDDSTAYDNPRPPIPSRIIEYREQRLRFMFIPGGDTHPGDAPPYQWKLIGITDMTAADPSQATVVAPSEAVVRMPCWSRK